MKMKVNLHYLIIITTLIITTTTIITIKIITALKNTFSFVNKPYNNIFNNIYILLYLRLNIYQSYNKFESDIFCYTKL